MKPLTELLLAFVLLVSAVAGSASPARDQMPERAPAHREAQPRAQARPAAPAPSARDRVWGVMFPVPLDRARAANREELATALDRIRRELPLVDVVFVGFATDSREEDWLAVLDEARASSFKVVAGFASLAGRDEPTLLRPKRGPGGSWDWGALGRFVASPRVSAHPALIAVQSVDEPWHHRKRPVYSAADLRSMYRDLHGQVADGGRVEVLVQMSRELWSVLGRRGDPNVGWGPGMADIVQISALELQDGRYQEELLRKNHLASRRVVHEATPELPLWSSVQTMGSSYGPSRGYWFPRERHPFHDLTRMLQDLMSPQLEATHPLTGIIFQQWDSAVAARRPYQITLGDVDAGAGTVDHGEVADEARAAIRRFWGIAE